MGAPIHSPHLKPSPESLNTAGSAEPFWVPVALTFGLQMGVFAATIKPTSPWDNLPWIGIGLLIHIAALIYNHRRVRRLEALIIDLQNTVNPCSVPSCSP